MMKETRTLIIVSVLLMAGYVIFSYKAFLITAVLLVIIALSSERFRIAAGRFFQWISKQLNRILVRLLLAVIYLLILTPIASLQKFFFQNPLLVKPEKVDTLFTSRNHIYTSKDFENPW